MNFGIIIQARMSSQRLPGKVLHLMGGCSLLEHLVERMQRVEPQLPIVVATSDDFRDDPIVVACEDLGVLVDRGPQEDVAGRILHAADRHGFEAVVRICADSPLLDQALVGRVVEVAASNEGLVITNVQPRRFPKGQSVEIVPTEMLREAWGRMTDGSDREHVMPYLYRHALDFPRLNVASMSDRSEVRLCVDTKEDLRHIETIVGMMERETWTYSLEQVLELHERALQQGRARLQQTGS